MIEKLDINQIVEGLMAEFDALLVERETVRRTEEEAKQRREELERQISGLQQSLQGLSLYATAQQAPIEVTFNLSKAMEAIGKGIVLAAQQPRTLTDCCRDVLAKNVLPGRSTYGWMSAVQVRQSLQASGFDFSQYTSNPLSSIHTTLKRLASNEEVEIDVKGETTLYRWKQPRVRVPDEPLITLPLSKHSVVSAPRTPALPVSPTAEEMLPAPDFAKRKK